MGLDTHGATLAGNYFVIGLFVVWVVFMVARAIRIIFLGKPSRKENGWPIFWP